MQIQEKFRFVFVVTEAKEINKAAAKIMKDCSVTRAEAMELLTLAIKRENNLTLVELSDALNGLQVQDGEEGDQEEEEE